MKRIGLVLLFCAALFLMIGTPAADTATPPEGVKQLEDMVVEEKAGAPGLMVTPDETVIELDRYPTIAAPGSIVDVLKTQAIIDFRGDSDFDPGVDSIYMRGFDAKRFVTAIDSLTVQKTGGRKSSNIVDYALLPAFLIERIEVLPGPHTALYDSKAIGGVLNFVTRQPERRDSLKPDVRLSTSYGSYNTSSSNLSVQGSANAFVYDLGYQKYRTDGYLRNTEADIDTVFGRFGLLLPQDGHITVSGSYSDADREAAVTNTGTDYDSDYPETEAGSFDPEQKPTWDSISATYRLNYAQNLPIGRVDLGAYYGEDNRNRAYYENAGDTEKTVMDTDWWQQGAKITDEIEWSPDHVTTVGYDITQLYDEAVDDDKKERIRKQGGFLQHQWGIIPSVDVKLGLRYEDVKIWVSNWSNGSFHIPGRDKYINRHWNEFIPKSFTTWKMDGVAGWLRDTSLSAGISRIWRAPDYHGDYNPQGRPAGAWLDPEHGIGYDLVFDRRLWRDISFQVGYAFYDIEDFIVSNREHALYSGAGAGSLRYSDYKINLDRVHRHGVDVSIGGHITDPLSFYTTYAWQKFDNRGDERAGDEELSKRADHRVSAGLRYTLFEPTVLMLDYYYQSEETTEDWVESQPDVWTYTEVNNDAYHVFDFGIQQTLFKQIGALKNGILKLWVKNIFDEDYYNASGHPATERNYGASFQVDL